VAVLAGFVVSCFRPEIRETALDIILCFSHLYSVYPKSFRSEIYRVFQKALYTGIPNVTVCLVLRKHLHLKAYKLSIVQQLEHLKRWIVFTSLNVNFL
jgi:hypothetical protein